ncbi:programmed cell death protein 2 [Melampsora americana]|nr:programmed cell death protein 2 [Melampsora americana]
MTNLSDQNIHRIKEVMGETYNDEEIMKALNSHQNDFEKALNHLLESPSSSSSSSSPLSKETAEEIEAIIKSKAKANASAEDQVRLHHEIITWGEPEIKLPTSPILSSNQPNNLDVHQIWDLDSSTNPNPTDQVSSTQFNSNLAEESREPLVLPSSPPKGSYQPMTVTGHLTPIEDFNPSSISHPIQSLHHQTYESIPISNSSISSDPHRPSVRVRSEPVLPLMSFEDQLNAAIRASLEPNGQVMNSNSSELKQPIKPLGTEEEQMSKALEESLAMSSTQTLEHSQSFLHPFPIERVRGIGKPVALRVQNPHLVFLPAVLNVLYAAKPFRDRILSFKPPSSPDLQPLLDHDLEGLWKGESKWRTEESWAEKPQPIELILAVQRLFGLMTHSKRSYLDVREISLLMGYEEGENIVWSLNEPNKGCHKAYETIAEAWKQVCLSISPPLQPVEGDRIEVDAQEYEDEKRLFHWRGCKMSLPLPDPEVEVPTHPSDNSTTCLILNTLGSALLNDIYAGIDAQVWLPESNTAHFLDGSSQIIAFEIDRKENNKFGWTSDLNRSSGGALSSTGEVKRPFGLETEFYVDRYLLSKRKLIIDLREEICKIEGEADVSLVRRDQLARVGGQDVLSNLKSVVNYLSQESQFPITTSPERESQKKAMLPKFRLALEKLEAEIKNLELKASTAQAASKAVFDIPQMKEVGPHDLCAVIVSDGFPGRDHMWTYTKADDGTWYKILDKEISSVTIETVLNDPAGIHMNAGHIFALYVKRSTSEESSIDSRSIPLRASLEAAIIKDNEAFDLELTEASTLQSTHPLMNALNQDANVMDLDSPRSDVAEADELVADADELGSGSNLLRLSGGSGLNEDKEDEEEEEEEEEEGECDLVELGFLKPMKGQRLDIKTMTGKVGGRPIWLDPKRPLDNEAVRCSTCFEPMSFLLQMNAPDDENPDAYLRTIYVFICRKMRCIGMNGSGGLKAFRFQLSEAESKDLLNDEETEESEEGLDLGKVFNEWELVCEQEEMEESKTEGLKGFDDPSDLTRTEIEGETDEEDARMKETKASVDLTFLKFQSRLSRAPDQVLRYLKVNEPIIKPLWVSDEDGKRYEPRRCLNCEKGFQIIEFQILSTILSSLGLEESSSSSTSGSEEGIDFGTILVYTCEGSCERRRRRLNESDGDSKLSERNGWVEEGCLVQMFSLDGVKI